MKQFAVYIASGRSGTIYIGVTSNLPGRIWQHKNKVAPGSTARYGCDKLVYFDLYDSGEEGALREKRRNATPVGSARPRVVRPRACCKSPI